MDRFFITVTIWFDCSDCCFSVSFRAVSGWRERGYKVDVFHLDRMGSGYLKILSCFFQPWTPATSWISFVSCDLNTPHTSVCRYLHPPLSPKLFTVTSTHPLPLNIPKAHHNACNVTLVSRGRVSSLFLARHKGALCRLGEREWKREVCRVTIKHDP